MRTPRLLAVLALTIMLNGCGGNDATSNVSTPAVTSSITSVSPTPGGVVVVAHDVTTSEGVPADISTFRFSGLDASGNLAFGPTSAARAARVTLASVPTTVKTMHIDYLSGTGKTANAATVKGTLEVPVAVGASATASVAVADNPLAPVRLVNSNNAWNLVIGGSTVLVKGVGFDYGLGYDTPTPTSTAWFSYVAPDIGKANANCVRTYGAGWNFATPQQQAQTISAMLATAAAQSTSSNKIMVLAGLVFDPSQGDMNTLIPQTVQLVNADPNVGNLLGWCIGNEIPSSQYAQLNTCIGLVKNTWTGKSSLQRPVMTAVPTVSQGQVSVIQQSLPLLDWLGINTFYGQFDATHVQTGFLDQQAANLASGGWTLPWMITEYYSYDLPSAPFGNYAGMPSQTMNGNAYYLELNSTSNATNFTKSYNDYIVGPAAIQAGSVGGCVLNWGPPHNSKLVAFWKEVYAYRGQFQAFVNPTWTGGAVFDRLNPVDAVAAMYGGSMSSQPCPSIVLGTDGDPQGISCSFKATLTTNPTAVAANAPLTATVIASDTVPLTFDWYLIGGTSAGYTGDITAANNNPQNFINSTTLFVGNGTTQTAGTTYTNTVTFNAPTPKAAATNVYQLRVIVRDNMGGAATAAVGFPMK